ncbi:amidohydrolase family protein [Kribbella sp. NPDC051586]|uniref:amidohydrolase family protein n=1 Tax=Kribbella sp. NPDC051586 TaxID=3364118 RepID=UPI00378A42BD
MAVDVHHHMLPPHLLDVLADNEVTTIGGEPLPSWKPSQSIDAMDKAGISRAYLSVPIPLHFLPSDRAVTLSDDINQFGADCVRQWPERFGFFASLPLPDVTAATAAAVRALDDLGASGVGMLTNHAGIYQGDPILDPLYDELDRRGAVVFVHPSVFTGDRFPQHPADGATVAGVQPSQLEFGFDTTRAVANLIFHDVDRRFPRIRFLFTHSAACVPSVLHKLLDRKPMVASYQAYLQEHGTPPPVDELLAQLRTAEDDARRRVRSLYFDTALSTADAVLDALRTVVPTDHILLGTDFPFGQEIGLRYTLDGLSRYAGFTDAERERVLAGNAQKLLG